MATPKTHRTGTDLGAFVEELPAARRDRARRLAEVFTAATGEQAVLWGSIVGYGTTTTPAPGGRTHEWPAVGFAVRGSKLALYGLRGTPESEELLTRLGPHEAAVSCIYLRGLDGVDVEVLTELVRRGHARSAVGGRPPSPAGG